MLTMTEAKIGLIACNNNKTNRIDCAFSSFFSSIINSIPVYSTIIFAILLPSMMQIPNLPICL